MLIPIRCFTCNKPIGNLYDTYLNQLKSGLSEKESLDKLSLNRFCCRRMLLTHVDLIQKIILYD